MHDSVRNLFQHLLTLMNLIRYSLVRCSNTLLNLTRWVSNAIINKYNNQYMRYALELVIVLKVVTFC